MRSMRGWQLGVGICTVLLAAGGCAQRNTALTGFTRSPYFDEQVRTYTLEPEVTVHINAPPAAAFDARKPTLLVIYALPNGNTIAQTIGCQRAPDLDWHFYIQHIGAQTRLLRARRTDVNLVVAYLEAGGRSWPTWRKQHADSGARIVALVDELRALFPDKRTTVALTAHSGGGSFLIGYLNAVTQLPDWMERIVWLDANYGYSDNERHAEKLLDWLQRSPRHYAGVVAYDDREIEVDGKKVVGPNGGTYRRTVEMITRCGQLTTLDCVELPDRRHCHALDGQLDIQLFQNPANKILHTVLVEKNGFIHALTFGTGHAAAARELFAEPIYNAWIQTGNTLPG